MVVAGCAAPRLFQAAGSSKSDLVQKYLDEGDDPNAVSSPQSALSAIANGCNCETIKKALAKGADPSGAKGGVDPALFLLAVTGEEPDSKVSFSNYANKAATENMGSEEAARPYFRNTDPKAWCPLYDATQILMAAGANPMQWSGAAGFNPFLAAVDNKRYGMVKAMLESKKVDLEIHFYKGLQYGTLQATELKKLNELAGAEKEKEWTKVSPHPTALIKAIENGDKEMVDLLLKAGANPNNVMQRGERKDDITSIVTTRWVATPLDVAKEVKAPEIAMMLQAAGGFALDAKPQ